VQAWACVAARSGGAAPRKAENRCFLGMILQCGSDYVDAFEGAAAAPTVMLINSRRLIWQNLGLLSDFS
jgi:hypothetical protein